MIANGTGIGDSWYISIDEEELEKTFPNCETVTCEVKKGGFLLINQLTPHRRYFISTLFFFPLCI
jgi:hypothetical protein